MCLQLQVPESWYEDGGSAACAGGGVAGDALAAVVVVAFQVYGVEVFWGAFVSDTGARCGVDRAHGVARVHRYTCLDNEAQ